MRIRIISVALLVVAAIAFPPALMGQREATQGSLSARQKFESEISNLEKNLSRAANLNEQLRLIERAEKGFRIMRKKQGRQVESDELFFDQFQTLLSEFPREKSFRKEECGGYQAFLVAHFEPKPQGSIHNPALKDGLEVLALLCR